jgi:hypothetical protein
VGELLQDWNQNSSPQDFINITNHFILCLLQRGHLLKDLIPILQSAVSTIDNSLNCRQRSYAEHKQDEALYIHWQFHPRDFDKAKICQIYNKTLKGHENFTQMWIAMSRPKNLRGATSYVVQTFQPYPIIMPQTYYKNSKTTLRAMRTPLGRINCLTN